MTKDLYPDLVTRLATSDTAQRAEWVKIIVQNNVDLRSYSDLLLSDKQTAQCFSWLLGELGLSHPAKLFELLPYFFNFSPGITTFEFQKSFAFYWLHTSVPEENEEEAIELLFDLLMDPKTQVTIKSRSAFVLQKLCIKYPELKAELRLCLEDQMTKNTKDFAKRANKIIKALNGQLIINCPFPRR